MKRIVLCLVALAFLLAINAANPPYYLTQPIGYGAAATGGGNATPILVSNANEFKNAFKGSNKVIIITQDIELTSKISVKNLNNITLLGFPGVTLTNLETDKSNSGILTVNSSNNIIIRNLTFIGPGAYDIDGNDLLTFDGVTNAWVDHCDFQDGLDGNFDNKHNSDNITVSWCRFRYLKAPIPGGRETDDHRFTNLLGSNASDAPEDGTYNFTWAYCWWDEGCVERMVRCRNASLHFLNCYWKSSVAHYYIGPENADAYVEGCYLSTIKEDNIFDQGFGTNPINGVKYVNSYYEGGDLTDVDDREVLVPAYQYTALTYTQAKAAVSNTNYGAGATLTVTEDGKISTAYTEPEPEPEPTSFTITFVNPDGETIGTQTYQFGDVITAPQAPELQGYIFIGWDQELSNIQSDTTVKARYAKIINGAKGNYIIKNICE